LLQAIDSLDEDNDKFLRKCFDLMEKLEKDAVVPCKSDVEKEAAVEEKKV
jgi:hypothetical protein